MYQRTQAHEEAFSWHLGQLATEAKEAALLGSIPTSSVAVENPAIADITVLKLAPRSVLTRFPSVGGVRALNLENCLLSFAPFAVCRHLDSWHPLSLTLSPRSTVRKVTSIPPLEGLHAFRPQRPHRISTYFFATIWREICRVGPDVPANSICNEFIPEFRETTFAVRPQRTNSC